jgi:multimeric flavodoxin WrbA
MQDALLGALRGPMNEQTPGQTVRVLGIWASPRRGGNSEVLLDAFLGGAEQAGAEVERVALRTLKITPCLEIQHCFKDGTCPIKDDMVPLYDALLAADVVALASPIFFYGVSAQAKAMIDRTQALWARRYVLGQDMPGSGRQGVLLCTAASCGRLLFVGARLTARYFFDAVNATYAAEMLVQGVDEKGAVAAMPEVLAAAAELGRRLARGERPGPVQLSPLTEPGIDEVPGVSRGDCPHGGGSVETS